MLEKSMESSLRERFICYEGGEITIKERILPATWLPSLKQSPEGVYIQNDQGLISAKNNDSFEVIGDYHSLGKEEILDRLYKFFEV